MNKISPLSLFTVPNLITCLNLISGAIAIERALYGDLRTALLFILLAAFFDFLDGFFARLLHAYSPIGKDLDSLADVVSFGVAPASIAFAFIVEMKGPVWYAYAAFLFSAATALRLAKFNNDPRQSTSFMGLPSPAAALLLSGFVYNWTMIPGYAGYERLSCVVLIFTWICGALMLLEIPMFSLKFKEFTLRKYALQLIFLALSLVALVLLQLQAIAYVLLLYLFLSCAMWLRNELRRQHPSR